MAEHTYTYSLATDFGGAINSSKLTLEIAASSIVIALERIDTAGDVVDIVFKDSPSQADKTVLDGGVTQTEESPPIAGSLLVLHDSTPNPSTEPKQNAAGVQYAAPQPQTIGLEMCDRDILIKTAIWDATASLTIDGATTDGDVTYTATLPGIQGNDVTVTHEVGATGGGNESRSLGAVFTDGLTKTLVVTFGTDGVGASITPIANDVVTAVNVAATNMFVIAAAGGDGTDTVGTQAATALTGGVSDSLSDVKIDPLTCVKSQWKELTQVGCYKDGGGGTYTLCTSQTDANTNAVLSVWRYCAHSRVTGLPTSIEVRDGHLIVDSAISDNLAHQAFAIGAPQIPASLGGSIVQFDAYLKYYAGLELGATSPSAKSLDPAGPGGPAGAELRVYIFYPAGEKLNHILRLVTYRPAGTF